jgi:predicted RNA binding protein YcfA (HicA-like mRNA interferase family)
MKLSHDIGASQLIKSLAKFGYSQTRQSGSHIRLTTHHLGEHHVTIPNHDPLKIGTLNAILSEVAQHLNLSKAELIKELF